jgi:SAM-dependent methyltransferase
MIKRTSDLFKKRNKIWALLKEKASRPVLKNSGYCSTCEQNVSFVARNTWLRDHYLCSKCGSLPRERALMSIIGTYFPNWRNLTIHESSPCNRGASKLLSQQCLDYIPSQFFQDHALGSSVGGIRCENLESLTFTDESIDLHISQDVLEHVFHPSKVFSEIARTLKPGGAHIFTVPMVNKNNRSALRARISEDGQISYIETPNYHGNPISNEGSLVTVDWGFDICQHIFDSCGLFTYVFTTDNLSKGISGEYTEVMITVKPHPDSQREAIP